MCSTGLLFISILVLCLCWFFAFVCLLDAIYEVQSPSSTKVINALNRSVLGKITVSYTRLADIYKCIGGRPRTVGLCASVMSLPFQAKDHLCPEKKWSISTNNTNETSMFFDQFFSLSLSLLVLLVRLIIFASLGTVYSRSGLKYSLHIILNNFWMVT